MRFKQGFFFDFFATAVVSFNVVVKLSVIFFLALIIYTSAFAASTFCVLLSLSWCHAVPLQLMQKE